MLAYYTKYFELCKEKLYDKENFSFLPMNQNINEYENKLPIGILLISGLLILRIGGLLALCLLLQQIMIGDRVYSGGVFYTAAGFFILLLGVALFGLLQRKSWSRTLYLACEILTIAYGISTLYTIYFFPAEYVDKLLIQNGSLENMLRVIQESQKAPIPEDYLISISKVVRSSLGYFSLYGTLVGLCISSVCIIYIQKLTSYFKTA